MLSNIRTCKSDTDCTEVTNHQAYPMGTKEFVANAGAVVFDFMV
jgi:hypothetical protein